MDIAGGMAGFQRRELRTLALLASGSTIPEMAATLGVTLEVAQAYVYRLYRKTGIRSVEGLTAFAKEYGLDDPSMVPPGKPYRRNPQMRGFFSLNHSA
jgi:DNA-binding CsgD family transcriptional regulator